MIDELQLEAKGATVAALIVRFEAWHDYVFPGDTPSPLETLGKMVVAGGDPIALVVAWQTSPAKASAYVRLLADHADDPQLRNELGKLAEDFKSYLKEHGLPEPSPLDGSSPTKHIDGFESASFPQWRFKDAQQTAKRALDLAVEAGITNEVPAMQERLELYRSGRPYREPAKSTQ